MQFPRPTSRRIALILLLLAAMLCAQWSGLRHRIEHGIERHAHSDLTASADHDDDGHAEHSCAAFDAMATADSVDIHSYSAPLLSGAQVLALWTAFDSWDAPLAQHFSPRAPPLA